MGAGDANLICWGKVATGPAYGMIVPNSLYILVLRLKNALVAWTFMALGLTGGGVYFIYTTWVQ